MKKQSDKRLVFIDPKKILPPKSSRATDRYHLFLLSESIKEYGLIIPITVEQTKCGYRVISGERRVKASIIAGEEKIPCIVIGNSVDPLLLKTVENMGRDRNDEEDALLIKRLCSKYSCDSVAVMLALTTGELNEITEKHQTEEKNLSIAPVLEPARTESLSTDIKPQTEREKRLPPIRDVRFLVNTIKQLTESVVSGGIKADYKQKETDKALEIRLRIEKEEIRQLSLF